MCPDAPSTLSSILRFKVLSFHRSKSFSFRLKSGLLFLVLGVALPCCLLVHFKFTPLPLLQSAGEAAGGHPLWVGLGISWILPAASNCFLFPRAPPSGQKCPAMPSSGLFTISQQYRAQFFLNRFSSLVRITGL